MSRWLLNLWGSIEGAGIAPHRYPRAGGTLLGVTAGRNWAGSVWQNLAALNSQIPSLSELEQVQIFNIAVFLWRWHQCFVTGICVWVFWRLSFRNMKYNEFRRGSFCCRRGSSVTSLPVPSFLWLTCYPLQCCVVDFFVKKNEPLYTCLDVSHLFSDQSYLPAFGRFPWCTYVKQCSPSYCCLQEAAPSLHPSSSKSYMLMRIPHFDNPRVCAS